VVCQPLDVGPGPKLGISVYTESIRPSQRTRIHLSMMITYSQTTYTHPAHSGHVYLGYFSNGTSNIIIKELYAVRMIAAALFVS
jgi:hypothetical protein